MSVLGCTHIWKPDWDEMVCAYCGSRLYPNEDPSGPKWRFPIQADSDVEIPDWLLIKAKQRKPFRKLPNH
jgi:hypothetical protein